MLGVAPTPQGLTGGCLLDSSAAIDGRVLALYRAGLLPLPLCVPAFIIWEMQGIADSGDPMRRRRGQRGLDMLATLREAGVEVRVLDEDPAGTTEPDAKLVVDRAPSRAADRDVGLEPREGRRAPRRRRAEPAPARRSSSARPCSSASGSA